ncbi:MAG: FixG Ig-like domain-containing protein, partial [Candidatus Thermoplasmatota archaeon]
MGMVIVFALLLISSGYLIAFSSTAETQGQSGAYEKGVEVQPPQDAVEYERDTYVYTYTIANLGQEEDTYYIEVESSNEVAFEVEAPENVSVEGDISVDVEVEVTIKEDAEPGDTATITLEAESEASGEVDTGSMYVAFKKPIDFEPPVDQEDAEAFIGKAKNAAAFGAVTFLKVEGYEPWAALVVNAGDPRGVDAVTVSFEDGTLIIEAEDENETNHVTILVNKAFADKYLGESEGDIEIEVSDAVNYEGLDNSNASAGGGAMYVFHIEHFSTQTIEISE